MGTWRCHVQLNISQVNAVNEREIIIKEEAGPHGCYSLRINTSAQIYVIHH